MKLDLVSLLVFLGFFALVTVLGFYAGQWRRGDLAQLHEWGLGGRRFGVIVSWFLIGGDLYTAYTLIAVPALVSAPAQPASSRCPTRSSPTRSCSW